MGSATSTCPTHRPSEAPGTPSRWAPKPGNEQEYSTLTGSSGGLTADGLSGDGVEEVQCLGVHEHPGHVALLDGGLRVHPGHHGGQRADILGLAPADVSGRAD